MNNNNIDYNVENYTSTELFAILNLDGSAATINDITNITTPYIYKYTSNNNTNLLHFFTDIQTRLTNEITDKISHDLNASLNQPIDDENKRVQNKSDNSYNISVKKDKLNPNLENTTSRLINLDSLYRQSSGTETSTDYTLDLSDPLKNVLNLRLYSIQIPFSWYVIDSQYNNNCFWITDVSNNIAAIKITMPSGNYDTTNFVSSLNTALINGLSLVSTGTYVFYQDFNGKITINLSGTSYASTQNYFTFFDFEGVLQTAPYVNSTLGWLMGYRDAVVNINLSGNITDCVIDLYGTKNLILIIDDFTQNHVNNSLISITETSKVLSLPTYYRPDLPFTIQPPTHIYANDLTDFADNAYITSRNIPIMGPSSPRILTQAQIYTINEITKNRERTVSYRIKAPTSPDIFAMIPIKRGSSTMGNYYIEFGSSLQVNKRVYFGPVNIERLRIKLLDDRGNVVNLNGVEWSVTLLSETLYQY